LLRFREVCNNMTSVLNFAVTCEVASNLDMSSLLCLGTCDHTTHSLATRLANDRMRTKYRGVLPLADSEVTPFWRRLADALQPNLLHFTYCGRNPDCTRLLNLVLDTMGQWFVEFEICTTETTKGMPCVGFVDASTDLSMAQRASGKVPKDLSRRGRGKLAVSFSPESDKLYASRPDASGSVNIDFGSESCRRGTVLRMLSQWSNWSRQVNGRGTTKAGFFINNRQMTFFRWNMESEWCSSGVIFRDLPDQVIPAIFLTSCAGYTSIRFVNLRSQPPELCTRCEALGHGFKRGAYEWPSDDGE